MPDGLTRLEAMGVSVEGRPFVGIRYIDGEVVAQGEFPPASAQEEGGAGPQGETAPRPIYGLGVRRTRLHAALVERAETLGVGIRWGVQVSGIDAQEARLQTSEGELRARFVVGADGLRSEVRRWAGLAISTDTSTSDISKGRARFGVRRHFGIRPWAEHVEVHWSDRAEAYVTPVAEDEVGIAILWSGAKGGFDHWLGLFPELEKRLAGAPLRSRQAGTGPLRQRVRSVVRGRLALVGDAAGYVDAITGEGLSVAFHQAGALANALAEAVRGSDPGNGLGAYGREHARIVRLPEAMTRLLLFVERHPALRRRVVRAFRRDPRLFRRFLAVHCRQAPARTLGLDAPRLLWRLALAR